MTVESLFYVILYILIYFFLTRKSKVNVTMEKQESSELQEWYENLGPGPGPVSSTEQPAGYDIQVTNVQKEPDKDESEEKESGKDIENLGEMYKALAASRAITSKLTAYSFKEEEEDKKKLKESIKSLAKKLNEIVNGL